MKLRKIDTPTVLLSHFHAKCKGIDLVKEIKYLGLMIDDCLKWESTVNFIQKKISRAIGILKYATSGWVSKPSFGGGPAILIQNLDP